MGCRYCKEDYHLVFDRLLMCKECKDAYDFYNESEEKVEVKKLVKGNCGGLTW